MGTKKGQGIGVVIVRSFELKVKEATEELGLYAYPFRSDKECYNIVEKTTNEWIRRAEIMKGKISVYGDENLEIGKKLAESIGISKVVIWPSYVEEYKCPVCG